MDSYYKHSENPERRVGMIRRRTVVSRSRNKEDGKLNEDEGSMKKMNVEKIYVNKLARTGYKQKVNECEE